MPANTESNTSYSTGSNTSNDQPNNGSTSQDVDINGPQLSDFTRTDNQGNLAGYSKSDSAYEFYAHNPQAAYIVAAHQGILMEGDDEKMAMNHFARTLDTRMLGRELLKAKGISIEDTDDDEYK